MLGAPHSILNGSPSNTTWLWAGCRSTTSNSLLLARDLQWMSTPTFNFRSDTPLNVGGLLHFGFEMSLTEALEDQSKSHRSSQSHAKGLFDMSLETKCDSMEKFGYYRTTMNNTLCYYLEVLKLKKLTFSNLE